MRNTEPIQHRILVVERGDCTFVDKARKAQEAGAAAVIVVDNVPGSSSKDMPMFAMSGDGKDDVSIPVVFLFRNDAQVLESAYKNNTKLRVSVHIVFRIVGGGPSCDNNFDVILGKHNANDVVEKAIGNHRRK